LHFRSLPVNFTLLQIYLNAKNNGLAEKADSIDLQHIVCSENLKQVVEKSSSACNPETYKVKYQYQLAKVID